MPTPEIPQVILNLLNNSIDALTDKSEKWILIKAEASEKNIIITVTDSGLGISKEVVDKMMSPFFSTKKIGHGTGLGLSISARIIQEHKGKLYYDSQEKHTTFKIELPRLQPK